MQIKSLEHGTRLHRPAPADVQLLEFPAPHRYLGTSHA